MSPRTDLHFIVGSMSCFNLSVYGKCFKDIINSVGLALSVPLKNNFNISFYMATHALRQGLRWVRTHLDPNK